jgi:hypothetical protein
VVPGSVLGQLGTHIGGGLDGNWGFKSDSIALQTPEEVQDCLAGRATTLLGLDFGNATMQIVAPRFFAREGNTKANCFPLASFSRPFSTRIGRC